MNFYFRIVNSFGLLFLAIWVGLLNPRLATADDTQPLVQADQSFLKSLQAGDLKAVSALLDEKFEWTDTAGKTRSKQETLLDIKVIADSSSGEAADVRTFNYGEVGYVLGARRDVRFLRVWVKRGADWRLFNDLETPIPAEAAPLPSVTGDCANPCRTLPYTPTTEMDKAILDAWQHAKNDEWHPNPDDWALRVADEFLIINRTARGKVERVGMIAKQRQNGEAGPPGDPIVSMRMFDFGDHTAVMLSLHNPYRGGKPYYNVRVWILRDSRWQLAVSQQTIIQSAAAAPASK